LKTYLEIIDDKVLTESFEVSDTIAQSENLEDDRILESIILAGKDKTTDCLLACFQKIFETSIPMVPYARLAGLNGLMMARAAFALLIKFGDLLEDFVSLVDQTAFFNEVEET
jgi:hypothetical protein